MTKSYSISFVDVEKITLNCKRLIIQILFLVTGFGSLQWLGCIEKMFGMLGVCLVPFVGRCNNPTSLPISYSVYIQTTYISQLDLFC